MTEAEEPLLPEEPAPVYPPKLVEWAPPFIPPVDIPGIVVGPVPTPKPPCDPRTDPECPPPPPPVDVPEPATWLVFLVGIIGIWFFLRGPGRARVD